MRRKIISHKQLARKFKSAREKLQMPQTTVIEMLKDLGVALSRANLSKIERGEIQPKWCVFLGLAQVYDLDINVIPYANYQNETNLNQDGAD